MVRTSEGVANATWDRATKMAFCELCIKEVLAGNRPTTHFNKEGWLNITNEFTIRTGKSYDRTQLKNKWDQLKKDWKLWKELKHGSTGLGWDPNKKTIDASNDWWREKLKVLPQAKKFRFAGIDPELEEKLDQMFGGVVATGVHAWTPSQGVQDLHKEVPNEPEQISNDQHEISSERVEERAESSYVKRPSMSKSAGRGKKKKGASFLRDQISQLVTAYTSSSESRVQGQPSLGEAIRVLEGIKEVFDDVPLYMWATHLLEDDRKREIFMNMAPERRVGYIQFWHSQRDSAP